jgi:recombination protein RecA
MSLKDDVTKNFGDNIILSGNSIVDKKIITIPVSPSLDIILNGGIPEGSFVVLTGQPKCGKTTTSLDFCATAQKPEYAYGSFKQGREVYYLNIEGRLKKRDLEGIPGLDLDRFHVIGSQQGKILHAEEYLQIGERIINEIPGSVLIIDSYSALCTEAEITSDMDKMQRADGAKLLAKFCRKVANVIPVNKNIVIGITHLMGNPTGYGAEFKEKSGQAIAYQTDIKLRAKTFKAWSISTDSQQIGQEVEWQVLCSALGPPGGNITSYIRYGQGVDRQMEISMLATDLGLIHKGGAWYTLISVEDKPKFQGTEKLRQYLVDNPAVYESLVSQVKETMGITTCKSKT